MEYSNNPNAIVGLSKNNNVLVYAKCNRSVGTNGQIGFLHVEGLLSLNINRFVPVGRTFRRRLFPSYKKYSLSLGFALLISLSVSGFTNLGIINTLSLHKYL